MNLRVKQIKKIDKKVNGTPVTLYQCVLKGYELFDTGVTNEHGKPEKRIVDGALTLESESVEALKQIVKQVIDAEVDIDFSHPQTSLEVFAEQ